MAEKTSPRLRDARERAGVIHRPDGLKYVSPRRAGAFLGLLRAADTLATKLSAELERGHGITLRGFEVLLFLAVFAPEGHLRVTELTKQAPLSQSRVSRLVADLEQQGLVERSPAEGDGRGVTVSITERGIERFKAAQETHLAGLERLLFSRLSEAEVRQLARMTAKIIEACEE